MSAYMSQTKPASSTGKTGKSPCGCGGGGASPCGCGCGCECHEKCEPCCTNVCFERPNYFCGHLLTDDDLTTGMRYVREKNKLYHRTLHGHGIVCGLGMRRDLDCAGQILIGEGFAIDACGNDLVVCEQQCFNPIAALRNKGYLVSETADPCREHREEDCHTRRCFWIAARYGEKPSCFEAPLENACSPGPTSCEPTRILETVEFDVLDCPPEHRNPIEEIISRFDCCFRLLREGNFARTVTAHKEVLGRLFTAEASKEHVDRYDDESYYNIFCQLKAYFLQHIRKFPDPYDAQLEHKVQTLAVPDSHTRERDVKDRVTPEMSFCGLFNRVWGYISNCLNSAMIFPCPAPKCGGEVILGTVEIENGKLARICYCGRSYVWSAANFWQVLVAYLVESNTCKEPEEAPEHAASAYEQSPPERHRHHHCCPEIDLNCGNFFDMYLRDQKSPENTVLSTLRMLTGLASAAKTAFNFHDPNAWSPKILEEMSPDEGQKFAAKLGAHLLINQDPPVRTPLSPMENMIAQMLVRPGDTITATVAKDRVRLAALSATHVAGSQTAVNAQLADTKKAVEDAGTKLHELSATAAKATDLQATNLQLQQLSSTAAKATDLQIANTQLQQLTAALQAKDAALAAMNEQFNALAARVSSLEKPPAPPAQGD